MKQEQYLQVMEASILSLQEAADDITNKLISLEGQFQDYKAIASEPSVEEQFDRACNKLDDLPLNETL